MAALYLHNALFTNEPQTPPVVARRTPSIGRNHDRQLSSVSSVTLRTSTSEHSHPTEPLLHSPYNESAFHELIPRQPVHLDRGVNFDTSLSLETASVGHRERRRAWELARRKRLKRLRHVKRALLLLIGAWAVYNTTRYYAAATIYTTHERRTIVLILGSLSGLSSVLVLCSFILSAIGYHLLGRNLGPHFVYFSLQSLLGFSSCLLLSAPAVVNFIFVFLWRSSPVPSESLEGRCHWDLDIFWSGTGSQCDSTESISWTLFLVGAVLRLVFTLVAVFAFFFTSRKYVAIRSPSRRRHSTQSQHLRSHPSVAVSEATNSGRSFRDMMLASPAPVSFRENSLSTSESDNTLITQESGSGSTEKRALRTSLSRLAGPSTSSSADGHGSKQLFPEISSGESSDSSSDEEGYSPSGHSKYGNPIRHTPGTYSLVPAVHSHQIYHSELGSSSSTTPTNNVAFNTIYDQISRETEAGIRLAQNDQLVYYGEDYTPSPTSSERSPMDLDEDVVQFNRMGGRFRRMPTIESLGSREVMSLASASTRGERSINTLSRPPTRSNTLTMSDGSRPPSRANSLSANIALSSPVDSTFNMVVTELGELTPASSLRSSQLAGTRSTASTSYHTAVSGGSPHTDGSWASSNARSTS
ncbi:hypothetical protein C8Q75DRAFT_86218 [Abortiporus biennis]|nr:hypothetical protein C8Q75DRAFT_86218 [Abortiporus biennis]